MNLVGFLIKEPFKILFTKFVDFLIPKDNALYVYGGALGKFADNSRFLFEYGLKNIKGVRHIWITHDKKTFSNLSKKIPKNVVYAKSLKGLFTLLRAKVVIISNSMDDINYKYISKKRHFIVNLWHGIPMKTIGLLDSSLTKFQKIYFKFMSNGYSLLTTCSFMEKKKMSLCWGLDNKNIVVTGYPRNDVLLTPDKKISQKLGLQKFKKVILYAPTWRVGKGVVFFPFKDVDLNSLNNFLKKRNYLLLLRAHLADSEKDLWSKIKKLSNINFVGQDIIVDVNKLLPFIDLLVTDYSGIYFDYLLLDRPIIFIPYDLKKFCRETGMLYKYDNIAAGPKVSDTKSFNRWIEKLLDFPTHYQEDRKKILNMFHKYKDKDSSKRIFSQIKKRI